MKILVLGATGMLGHMACRVFSQCHDVRATVRRALPPMHPLYRFLPPDNFLITGDLPTAEGEIACIASGWPDVVLNAIGVIKQKLAAAQPILSIRVNALLPHLLARACDTVEARMIQLSTDCVFSGRKGNYNEFDLPDPIDLYGRSKLLGEVTSAPHLTIRTSIIGRQLAGDASLLEWLISQRGKTIKGFSNAIYSGLTTHALCVLLLTLIEQHRDLSGLFHIAASPIDKYHLLRQLNERLKLNINIERDTQFVCDRSLDGRRFCTATGLRTPSWDKMIDQLAEAAEYHEYRGGEEKRSV